MAELTGKAVSELPEATNVQDSDLLALSQNASSKKVFAETLVQYIVSKTQLIVPPIASNMDAEVYGHDGIHFNRYISTTAHTPYTDGLTTSAEGYCVTFMSGTYGSQTVYPNGQASFFRREIYEESGGGIAAGAWKTVTTI